jgi:hypothetical protein
MSAYLFAALLVWCSWITPIEDRSSEDTLRVWADAIANHCGTDVKRCTFMAALAFEESGFRVHVLNEDCNQLGWSRNHPSFKCDDGFAWGAFQLHAGSHLQKKGMDPRHASPDEQARIAMSLPEGAWSRVTRGLAHPLANNWIVKHPWGNP